GCPSDPCWPEHPGRTLQPLEPVGDRVRDPDIKLVVACVTGLADRPNIRRPSSAAHGRAVQNNFGDVADLPKVEEQWLMCLGRRERERWLKAQPAGIGLPSG